MSEKPVNSMPATWCAARVAEARAWRDAHTQATPGWQHVHELLSQLDAPADYAPLAAAARPLAALADRRGSTGRAASDPLWRAYRAQATPAVVLALVQQLGQTQARLATLEAAGAAGAGREAELLEANAGFGDMLADTLHDLREAWAEADWSYVQNLIRHLESKAGPTPGQVYAQELAARADRAKAAVHAARHPVAPAPPQQPVAEGGSRG